MPKERKLMKNPVPIRSPFGGIEMVEAEPDIVQEFEDDIDEKDDETPEERFRRIAVKRINRILGDLALLEQMSSGNYRYTMNQVEAMLAEIEKRVERVRQRYVLMLTHQKPAKARHSFKF